MTRRPRRQQCRNAASRARIRKARCDSRPNRATRQPVRRGGQAVLSPGWACYHTELYEFEHERLRFGIVACAVGASFAVLLAEQLFVSGCHFLISMTSA